MIKAAIAEIKSKIHTRIEALKDAQNEWQSTYDTELHNQTINALKEIVDLLKRIEVSLDQSGRPRVVKKEVVQNLKEKGHTQEMVARELNISLSTVRRNWKSTR